MLGRIFAQRPRDMAPRRGGLLSQLAGHRMPSPAHPAAALSRKWHRFAELVAERLASKTALLTSARRHWRLELGVLFHLACIGVVGAVIIALFFGAGLYSLGRPTGQLTPVHNSEKPAGLTGGAPSTADPPPDSAGVLAASTPDAAQPSATDTTPAQVPQAVTSPNHNRGGHRSYRHHAKGHR
jgi:hypothetical protein